MKQIRTDVLRAACLSAALLGGLSVGLGFALTDYAFAAGGNGNGNGNGNGKGNGNGNGKAGDNGGDSAGGSAAHGNSAAKGTGASASKKQGADSKDREAGTSFSKSHDTAKKSARNEKLVHAPKAEATAGSKRPKTRGVHPSELGALNAAHASAAALANASPNSRVGKIAIYRDAVLQGQELQADYDLAVAELAGLTPPANDLEAVTAELAEKNESRATAQQELDALYDERADLEAIGGADPDLDQRIADAEGDLALRDAEISELESELAAAEDYETAADTVENLSDQLADQELTETSLLEAAANKPVTPEIEDAVQQLLGLE